METARTLSVGHQCPTGWKGRGCNWPVSLVMLEFIGGLGVTKGGSEDKGFKERDRNSLSIVLILLSQPNAHLFVHWFFSFPCSSLHPSFLILSSPLSLSSLIPSYPLLRPVPLFPYPFLSFITPCPSLPLSLLIL